MMRRIPRSLLFLPVLLLAAACGKPAHEDPARQEGSAPGATQVWTCSMHPQIRQPAPGQCPLCGMDLIPAGIPAGGGDSGQTLTLTPAARKLAEVVEAPVERRAVEVEVRLVGKVQFDETRQAYIATRVPGRIDRLYADYAGMSVKAGDHLADLYSPELVSAQQELLQAKGGGAAFEPLLRATRERLRLWGLTPDQIAEIESSGKVRDRLTFFAPIGGVLVQKDAREGLYVETGTRLFTVADLSHVWVLLSAFESDLAWLRYAQPVTFQTEAYPGEKFEGVVSFIDPVLDSATRTVNVRVNVPNPDGRLKPEMFVRAVVRAAVTADGRVAGRDLSGRWICPMHPEVVADAPGACPRCGMPIVPAQDLGYAVPATNGLPLVIPATAPLLTGLRAVVYVARTGQEGVYEGREVELGPRAGDYFIVRSGLNEGERVVANGAFKIDSSLQIQGKPSMMAPRAESAPPPSAGARAPVPESFRKQLDAVVEPVLAAGAALAADKPEEAKQAAAKTRAALTAVDPGLLDPGAREDFSPVLADMRAQAERMEKADGLEGQRLAFDPLSGKLIETLRRYGPVRAAPLQVIRCPMAFDNRGASWLQAGKDVRNAYFGGAMRECGEVVETLPGETADHD